MKRKYTRKLTLWFDGYRHRPMRPGVYQVSATGPYHHRGAGHLYCYWNGATWGLACASAQHAVAPSSYMYINRLQSRAWRGRTQP